jgi:hypothetical protein
MSTTGVRGKVKEIVLGMQAVRSHPTEPRNIGLRAYLSEKYDGMVPDKFYHELGLNPRVTTVQQLMADSDNAFLMAEVMRDGILQGMGVAQRERMEELRRAMVNQLLTGGQGVASQSSSMGPILGASGTNWITPEVYLDPVSRGAVQAAFYNDLIIRSVSVPQPDVRVPLLDLSDAKAMESEEGVTIEEGSVKYGDKTVSAKKKAKGIKYTYASLMFNTLDLVSIFFMDFGKLLGHGLNNDCVTTIISGDQANGSEAAAVIGVEDSNLGIQYGDVLNVWIQLALLGRLSTSIIGNAISARKYLELPEVKNKQNAGSILLPTRVKVPLPTEQDLYLSGKVPGKKLVFQDSSIALIQIIAQALMLEVEKIASRQIAGTYASIYSGFVNIQRNARVVLDPDHEITENGFGWPDWMQPYSDSDDE